MNKSELITAMAKESELKKIEVEKALVAFEKIISEELHKGEKVQLVGFGTFETSKRAEHQGRNPRTGEAITIAASISPKFKAGKALKNVVNT